MLIFSKDIYFYYWWYIYLWLINEPLFYVTFKVFSDTIYILYKVFWRKQQIFQIFSFLKILRVQFICNCFLQKKKVYINRVVSNVKIYR